MIKHKLAAVPAGEAHHHRREGREGEAVRQDRRGIDEAQAPVPLQKAMPADQSPTRTQNASPDHQ